MRSLKLNNLIDRLGRCVYPWLCKVCQRECGNSNGICSQCYPLLPWCGSVCDMCGLPIKVDRHRQYICGRCQQQKPYFDHLFAPLWYELPIRQLIVDFKYSNRWEYAPLLINLFASRLQTLDNNALLLPVPSHPTRIRIRGFNAIHELIRLLRHKVSIEYHPGIIKRVLATETQTGKSKRERLKNVKHAFKVVNNISHKKVILFDDVVTTCATINEVSKLIKNQGVAQIEVWALARTKYNFKL